MATGGPAGQPLLATAAELADVLDRLTKRLNVMARTGRRRTVGIIVVAVSVALDIALSLVVVALVIGLSHAQASIRASQAQACATGNQFRAAQVQLWDHLIAVSKAPPRETPAQRAARLAQLAGIRAYVARQFAPVRCSTSQRPVQPPDPGHAVPDLEF